MSILILLSLSFWFPGFAVFWKVPLCRRSKRRREGHPKVTVIIPARNEEHNLPKLLKSLNYQSVEPGEIFVVDDESEDRTAEVAESFGAKVIRPGPRLPGWNGKSWACWQGAAGASGEYLLFLDADTFLEEDGLEKLLETRREQGGLLSVQPFHTTNKPYEQLSAFLNVIVMAGMNAFTLFGKQVKPSGSFGPCILCLKNDYFSTGGHKAVYKEKLEDIPFGKNFQKHGIPVSCFGGAGTINFRMYPGGLMESVYGWSKSFAVGASGTASLVMLAIILWISGAFMASGVLIGAPGHNVPLAFTGLTLYALYVIQFQAFFKRVGTFNWLVASLFPLPLLFFVAVHMHSFVSLRILKTARWKGRTV
jgi:4,4'-diaponeurosporenoate glycosyltransferase